MSKYRIVGQARAEIIEASCVADAISEYSSRHPQDVCASVFRDGRWCGSYQFR